MGFGVRSRGTCGTARKILAGRSRSHRIEPWGTIRVAAAGRTGSDALVPLGCGGGQPSLTGRSPDARGTRSAARGAQLILAPRVEPSEQGGAHHEAVVSGRAAPSKTARQWY
jgi:hypothetical protein